MVRELLNGDVDKSKKGMQNASKSHKSHDYAEDSKRPSIK